MELFKKIFYFLSKKKDPIGYLHVVTDWDFGLIVKGKKYMDFSFIIPITDLEELKWIEYLGPFGAPRKEGDKTGEIEYAIKNILKNPNQHFSNLGGNRGAEWCPAESE
jgi:hypothetical protein